MCECASTIPPPPLPSLPRTLLFKSSYCRDSAGFWEICAFWEFEWARGNTLNEQGVRVLLAFLFFLMSVSLCVLQPVGLSHIPRLMTHYPSTQNTVSPCYFTAMMKSGSHTCCFISLILSRGPIIAFMINLQIQVIAFMMKPSCVGSGAWRYR